MSFTTDFIDCMAVIDLHPEGMFKANERNLNRVDSEVLANDHAKKGDFITY